MYGCRPTLGPETIQGALGVWLGWALVAGGCGADEPPASVEQPAAMTASGAGGQHAPPPAPTATPGQTATQTPGVPAPNAQPPQQPTAAAQEPATQTAMAQEADAQPEEAIPEDGEVPDPVTPQGVPDVDPQAGPMDGESGDPSEELPGESEEEPAEDPGEAAAEAQEEASAEAPETCDPSSGSGSRTVNATIVVRAGDTFDGECRRFVAGRAVGDGSQAEGQDPVFRLERGATLLNVVLGSPAADGIHTYGDATLRNITWEDIGEDALTIKQRGTVRLDGGSAQDGADKVFQINAASTFHVSNFRATNAGKFIRQNGGTGFTIHVHIDNCDISRMKEAIFRTDSRSSTVTMTNTRYSRIGPGGDDLWKDVNPANITTSNNTQY